MHLLMTYDSDLEACTVRSDQVVLRTESDVASWGSAVESELSAARHEKPYLLVDLDGLEIEMSAGEAFGNLVRDRLLRRAAAVRFYGHGVGFTRTVLLLESVLGPSTLRPLEGPGAARDELARVRKRRLNGRDHAIGTPKN